MKKSGVKGLSSPLKFHTQMFATVIAFEESSGKSPLLADVWKVLTKIKMNTEKLVLKMNVLKVNYKELQDNLASVKA